MLPSPSSPHAATKTVIADINTVRPLLDAIVTPPLHRKQSLSPHCGFASRGSIGKSKIVLGKGSLSSV